MSRYGIIQSDVWGDEAFENCSVIAKLMYLYFLSCESCNFIGYYRIKPKIIAAEMGIPEKEILPELLGQKKLWKYDEDTNQLLIPNYIKYNPIRSDSQVGGVWNALKPLKICPLHKYFLFSLQKYSGEEKLGVNTKESREIFVKVREMCREQKTPVDISLYRLLNKYISTS